MGTIRIDRNLIDENDNYEVDLSEFDNEEIIDECLIRERKFGSILDDLKDAFDIEECEECEDCELSNFDTEDIIDELKYRNVNFKMSEAETIRDEQYEEVFEKLKDKFTVQQLQNLLSPNVR